jgi:hypothetical protein
MTKSLIAIVFLCFFHLAVTAEPIRLSTSNLDYQITNVFGDVDLFTIDIDLDIPLQPGLYDNPTILNVSYRVFGSLEPGTPSGFPQFDLQRNISGAEFYQQGGSLMFEIADNADFSDGIQADELVDNGTILTLNAREVGNGRFHPPIFELYSDGTGRIQNSNNVHTVDPLLEVNFGDEYITDLEFEMTTTALFSAVDENAAEESSERGGGGSICWSFLLLITMLLKAKSQTLRYRVSV